MYEILHLTKDNQLVALNDKSIYYLDLFSGELIATKEFIHTDKILKCIKGYVFVLTDDRHALDIYIAKDFTKLYHLNIGEAITDIYDIAGDGAKILLHTNSSFTLWDGAIGTKIVDLGATSDISKATISADGNYIAYIKNETSIHVYDIVSKSHNQIKMDFFYQYNLWEKDLLIVENEGNCWLYASGPLYNNVTKANLLIIDIQEHMLLAYSTVSPTKRVPGVTHIMGVTDKYIILCAMYGYMDNRYLMWLADKQTGEYVKKIEPEKGGTISVQIDSLSKYFLIAESEAFNWKRDLQFVDIENEQTILLEFGDKELIPFNGYKNIAYEGAFGDTKRGK